MAIDGVKAGGEKLKKRKLGVSRREYAVLSERPSPRDLVELGKPGSRQVYPRTMHGRLRRRHKVSGNV